MREKHRKRIGPENTEAPEKSWGAVDSRWWTLGQVQGVLIVV